MNQDVQKNKAHAEFGQAKAKKEDAEAKKILAEKGDSGGLESERAGKSVNIVLHSLSGGGQGLHRE